MAGPLRRHPQGVAMTKYGAIPTEVDGIRFASRREAKRYGELKMLEKAGAIRNLELQPTFTIVINGVRIGSYRADFAYFEGERRVVEDVKGVRTQLYIWKKKCVEALYPGVTISEVA